METTVLANKQKAGWEQLNNAACGFETSNAPTKQQFYGHLTFVSKPFK